MRTPHAVFALFLSQASLALADMDVVGVVIDAQSDMPVPKVRFFDPDSQFLGASDDQGHFQLSVPRPKELTLRKNGYRTNVLGLAQVGDPLDISVSLEPIGTRLDDRTIDGAPTARRTKVPTTITGIEEMAGLRFDLQEHLRTLPGVSGTREFTSEVSVYGSRSGDVVHLLGPFAIPNLRHLDLSFPGNTSVLSPRVLQSIKLEHDPSKGPLEQGLASAIQYQPLVPSGEHIESTVSLGLTNRELDLATPLAGDATLVASGRWLDPTLLKLLGDRFFAGVLLDGKNSSSRDTSKLKSTNFDLAAFDGFARASMPIGSFQASVTAMGASDDHKFELYAGSKGDEFPVVISKGDAQHLVTFGQIEGDASFGYVQGYAGRVYTASANQYGDTSGYSWAHSHNKYVYDYMYWAALKTTRTDDRAGATWRPTATLLGAEPELLGVFHVISDERTRGRELNNGDVVSGTNITTYRVQNTLDYQSARTAGRLRWPLASGTVGLSLGALWVSDVDAAPEASLSWSGPLAGFGIDANASLRQEEHAQAVRYGVLGNGRTTSMEAKLGAGHPLPGGLNLSMAAYVRGLANPALPSPEMWWQIPQAEAGHEASLGDVFADVYHGVSGSGSSNLTATVTGLTGELDWRSFHTVQMQVNASTVHGQYQLPDGRSLDWEANRKADFQTLVRIHPRRDTLLSILFSHSASLGKPYYRYTFDTSARTVSISPDSLSQAIPDLQDLFRTDMRIQLDLKSTIPPFKSFRFYFEAQNLFANFDADWAKPLGGGNARQRGWQPVRDLYGSSVTEDRPLVYNRVAPLFANGTGLFFSFGIEGNLSL